MNLTEEAKEKRAAAYAQHCANHPDGCKYDHCDEWAYGFEDGYKIAAALASQWVKIETEADLPTENKQYLWRTNLGCAATDYLTDTNHAFLVGFYSAWCELPPFQEEADA